MDIVIFADDLTGANDTGIAFSSAGAVTTLLFSPDKPLYFPECFACAIDVNSRGCQEDEARLLTLEAAESVRMLNPHLVYKKIDSALRGTIGAECTAILEVFKPDLCVIAPAFPAMGRTTINGIQLINGIPVHETEMGKDPLSPVTKSRIIELLSTDYLSSRVMELGRDVITDLARFNKVINQLNSAESQILICDAESDEDLDRIVANVEKLDRKVIWVGSAGLAQALARKIKIPSGSEAKQAGANGWKTEFNTGRSDVLVASGSQTAVNARQLERLSSVAKLVWTEFSAQDLLVKSLSFAENMFHSDIGLAAISIRKTDQPGRFLQEAARQRNIGLREMNRLLLSKFGRLIRIAIDENEQLGLLVMVGGETSRHICEELGVSVLRLNTELLPGVIAGTIPEMNNLSFVSKSGAFGSDDTLLQILNKWRGETIEF
ncbi:four-carbon acid sugar kinase family protein [Paenibacillus psychroresistens]|uniref:Four-carbon acid sugar kinase family protein n=1 Tax=Paenibacillus psychroresistens TaxID=1778678 RepID=A0A6B8RUM5_9BACL|nr:four-carbon acid sugar kinase family protein [Paenibacillus psychroresistens]QGQ99474.1 four-carbon acid sugar kinase family protein [Paenibacillus psychroresistens]